MKPAHWLALPWMALSKDSRRPMGIGCVLLAILLVPAAAIGYTRSEAAMFEGMHIVAMLVLLYWAVVMSSSLLLLRTASRLRLPTLARDVCASVALYALLTIALPALALGMRSGNCALALVELALGAGLGMGYASLPAFAGTWLCLIPALSDQTLARWLPMPARSIDGYLAWAAPCTALLWLAIGWFWRSATQRDDGLDGIRKPILLAWRNRAWYGRAADQHTPAQALRQRWRLLQPVASLQGSGPDRAVASLRVALGGWAMPQTSASRLRMLLIWLITLGIAALAVMWQADAQPGGVSLGMVCIVIAGPLFAQTQAMALQRRWGRCDAELPLLALLPGLGHGMQTKRSLLRASLLPALGVQCLLLIAACCVAALLHMGIVGWLVLPLDQVLGMAMLVVYTLATFGGTPLDGWGFKGFYLGTIFIVGIGGTMAAGSLSPTATRIVLLVLAVIAAAMFVSLANLGLEGWRRFQCRPHPFLPTA